MSTKIYTGFKLKTTDMEKIHARMNDLRATVEEFKNKSLASSFAAECTHMYDKRYLDNSIDKSISVFQVVYGEHMNREKRVIETGVKDPTIDYSLSMTIFPFEGQFYGMFYTVQNSFVDLVYGMDDIIEYYGYWNNTDPDENCTEAEWNERERVWEAIFENNSIPALVGFNYEIALDRNDFYPSANELADFVPSLEARAKAWAKDTVYRNFVKNRTITKENVMKILRKFKEHCETGEGKSELVFEEEYAKKNLRLVIGPEQLAEKA